MSLRAMLLVLSIAISCRAAAGSPEQLYSALLSKVTAVKDYTAEVKMKIDVTYMRMPMLRGRLYYKAPDKMRMERSGGISLLPKKNVNLALSTLIPNGNVTVIDAGMGNINGKPARILKVIPQDDRGDIVLTKIWIDEAAVLALRTETTTQNDGTVIMDMQYGNYISYALPDRVTITLDVKEYKLPRGVTMDYGDAPAPTPPAKDGKRKKGKVDIYYLSYQVNTGLSDDLFKKRGEE